MHDTELVMPALQRHATPDTEVGPLLERWSAGDPSAARELVRRVGRLALPVAAGVLGGRAQAEDIVQEIVLDAMQSLTNLRDPDRFEAWVHRISVRHSRRALRARALRHGRERSIDAVEVPCAGAGPEGALAERDELRAALMTLPVRQRTAIVLRYLHGLTDAEIARALGCRVGTAGSLLSRARATLRERLRPDEGGRQT